MRKSKIQNPKQIQNQESDSTQAHFEFERRRIEDRDEPSGDLVILRGTFTLGENSNGIDPVNEEVQVTIDGVDGSLVFSQTLPPGSFEVEGSLGRREFEIDADVEGWLEEIELEERGEGRYGRSVLGRRDKAPGRPQSHGASRGEPGAALPVLPKNKEGPDPSSGPGP